MMVMIVIDRVAADDIGMGGDNSDSEDRAHENREE
jgi:phenylpyruvate tautomerase PptA (4-oxalocrotonate tautomerase family)